MGDFSWDCTHQDSRIPLKFLRLTEFGVISCIVNILFSLSMWKNIFSINVWKWLIFVKPGGQLLLSPYLRLNHLLSDLLIVLVVLVVVVVVLVVTRMGLYQDQGDSSVLTFSLFIPTFVFSLCVLRFRSSQRRCM